MSCLCRPLTKAYQEVLRTVFMSSTSSPSGANKKKSMKDLQEEVTNLYNNIRLFEKGSKFFFGKSFSKMSKTNDNKDPSTLFSTCTGNNVLVLGTLQGKLHVHKHAHQ